MMMKVVYSLFFLAAILVIACFPKRIMRYLGLDPGRARDFFGYFAVVFLIILVESFFSREWTSKGISLLMVGVILGVPITIVSNYFTFGRIQDNVLGGKPTGKGRLVVGVLLCMFLGFGTVYMGFVTDRTAIRELAVILWGVGLTSLTGVFARIVKYERKHGILYLKRKPDGPPQPH